MDADARRTRCRRLSDAAVAAIERFFYAFGSCVAMHPWRFLAGALATAALCSAGLLAFRQERHPLKLWIPAGSDFYRDSEWLMGEFHQAFRTQALLVTAPDVLHPYVLQQLFQIHKKILNVSMDGITFEDVCFRIPVIDFETRKKREIELSKTVFNNFEFNFDVGDDTLDESMGLGIDDGDISEDYSYEFDPSVVIPTDLYCSFVKQLQNECFVHSILDFWKYDDNKMENLTKEDIIEQLNHTTKSPVYGHDLKFKNLLGDIRVNESGYIVSAGSLLTTYYVNVNFSEVNMDESGNDVGTADWATGPALLWEKKFLEVMSDIVVDENLMKVYYESGRSFGDISSRAVFQDIDKLAIGIVLMFFFVQIVLSKFNLVEFRFILANIGLACIGMAFVVSVGLCSLLGISYGPVHTALPFLLLGIGVDDMFVIMTCWKNLSPAERQMSLPEKMGRTMQHAGTSITITSLTDVVAFLVGATTILPSLQSFCLYAAMGVLVTFLFQVTLFVACFVLDERRIHDSRNSFLFCITHQNYKPNSCSQIDFSKKILNKLYSKIILTPPGQVLILTLTLALAGVCIKGNMELKQKFDPNWFLPENSYLYKFIQKRTLYYPDMGQDAGVYIGRLNYTAELANIESLIQRFRSETDILKDVDDWYGGFKRYVNKHFHHNISHEVLSEEEFNICLSKYLYSPSGASYQKNFRFEGQLECGKPAPPITVSSFEFKFKLFHGPEESLPAMNRVKDLVANANFTTGDAFATVWGKIFANWVTDEVIDTELYRNLLLACLCVMLCTTVLIVNLTTCFMVFVCVLLTLLDVAGIMYFWGLTIDIVSCIGLELAAGLCVDYAAHIGHTFLTCTGTRKERALKTVADIGPAIISGGTATLLALSVLANSESYVFVSFFKIFLLVILFGLFHGTVFLPVILSLVGPDPYQTAHNFDAANMYDLCSQSKDRLGKSSSIEKPS